MKKLTSLLVLCTSIISGTITAQLPRPTHVIFVLEENYSYSEVIGSSYAPTFTALSKTSYTANFTQAYAIEHPSEPNYLDLYSGSNQGITSDLSGPAPNAPFNDCNLGASVIQAGFTFKGYSEDQPSVGWYAGDNGEYVTKHCPWINWMKSIGDVTDPIPDSSDVPFFPLGTYFPDSNHYNTLPTVTWVIPNALNDMHDGSQNTAIPAGDAWFKKNMMSLVRWAANPANNTIVITLWDEDDKNHNNNIPLLVSGGMIVGGNYSNKVDHYGILRTVEDMYNLPECGSSSGAKNTLPLTMWLGVNSIDGTKNYITVWPVPASDRLNIKITSSVNAKSTISINDITGRVIKESIVSVKPGENSFSINTEGISNGIYFVNMQGGGINVCKKVVVQK